MKLLLTLVLSGSVAAFSQASLFDFASAFPNGATPNPNGPWSYRSATAGFFGPNSSLFTASASSGGTTSFYNTAGGASDAAIFRNATGGNIGGVPNGAVAIRPGTSLLSGFRFTSPEAGPVVLNATIGAGDPGSVDIIVAVNGFTVTTTPNVSTASTFSFTSPVNANVGDTLEVFFARTSGSALAAKPITATIQVGQPVPEPATLATLAAGGLALLRRRKTRR